jgi:hypothetical protein
MNSRFFKAASAAFVLTAVYTFAAPTDAEVRNLQNRVTALEQRKGSSGVILPPGGPNLENDYGVHFGIDALLFKPTESLVYGQENGTAGSNALRLSQHRLHYQLNPGIRAFIGYRPGHDAWELRATWSWINNVAKGSHTAGTGNTMGDVDFSLPTLSGALSNGTSMKSRWRQNFNQIDFDLSRNCYLSKWLALKPRAGLRTAWIYQKNTLQRFDNVASDSSLFNSKARLHSNYWGLGPVFGLDSRWGLGKGFSIFTETAVSILWGYFNTANVGTVSTSATKFTNLRPKFHGYVPNLDVGIGLSWEKNFYDDQYYVALRASYEFHTFWDAYSYPSNGSTKEGDMTMSGPSFGVRFSF